MTRIILLSGAPCSGKNEFASRLMRVFVEDGQAACTCSIARVLKEATHQFYAALQPLRLEPAPAWNAFEHCKDKPHPFFLGKTPRNAYIDMHEMYIKPVHGQTYLADTLALLIRDGGMQQSYRNVIVTDVGNDREAASFSRIFSQVTAVTIEREGVKFDNRRLIVAPDLTFRNDGTISDMVDWIKTELFASLA